MSPGCVAGAAGLIAGVALRVGQNDVARALFGRVGEHGGRMKPAVVVANFQSALLVVREASWCRVIRSGGQKSYPT